MVGTFDSLNPMIVQGGLTSARGLSSDPLLGNLVFESLLMRSADEPFTLYGFIAETVETPPDRGWVEFTISPKAKFSDGQPVTVDDVIFSLELLRDKGRPNYRSYYSKVERIERIGDRGVRFHIENADDRELPLILGLMPVLPKHAINPETFDKSTLDDADRHRPLPRRRGAARPTTSSTSGTPTTGRRTCRSSAASTISTRSASTTTATPTRCSRRSRRGSTRSTPRATRRSGTPPTTSPPSRTGG